MYKIFIGGLNFGTQLHFTREKNQDDSKAERAVPGKAVGNDRQDTDLRELHRGWN